jgi:predicted amidohydrolase YtcJ
MSNLAVTNAHVVTLDPVTPTAEAVLIRSGRIALAGSNDDVLRAAGDDDSFQQYDAGGRTLVPGFIDGHAHFELTCCALTHCLSLTTPPYNTLESLADAIYERVSATPKDRWILVRGSFNLYARLEDKRLFTRQELDAISEDHPIMVYSSLHVNMLNTRALKELGLWDREPPKGVVVHRAEDGTPTGAVTEVWDLVPPFTVEEVKTAIREQGEELFLSKGITTIHNLPYSAEDILAVQELQAAGELPIRFRNYYHVPHQIDLDSLLAMGLKPGFGDDRMRFGGVKIFIDGVGHDGYGKRVWDLKWEPDDLIEFVCKAHAWGQQLWMHVCSPLGIRLACDAVEEAMRRSPRPHRHRIEHAADYLIEDDDITRVRDLGILAITTPVFVYQQGDTLALPNSERFPRQFRLRTLIDRGYEVIGSSDSTGSIPDGIPPLYNIACAVTRKTLSGNTYHPEEAITVEEALKLFTIWPAKGTFEEHDKGTITPGKLGDLTVLTANPFDVEPEELFEVDVAATIIGGEVVWQRS